MRNIDKLMGVWLLPHTRIYQNGGVKTIYNYAGVQALAHLPPLPPGAACDLAINILIGLRQLMANYISPAEIDLAPQRIFLTKDGCPNFVFQRARADRPLGVRIANLFENGGFCATASGNSPLRQLVDYQKHNNPERLLDIQTRLEHYQSRWQVHQGVWADTS